MDIQIWLMIIYRREFSVMFVMFSNCRVTHLRDLDAWDGFGNIQKYRVMTYERENSSSKFWNSFDGVQNSFRGVRNGSNEVQKSFGVAGN
jgi:hypothetical protein